MVPVVVIVIDNAVDYTYVDCGPVNVAIVDKDKLKNGDSEDYRAEIAEIKDQYSFGDTRSPEIQKLIDDLDKKATELEAEDEDNYNGMDDDEDDDNEDDDYENEFDVHEDDEDDDENDEE